MNLRIVKSSMEDRKRHHEVSLSTPPKASKNRLASLTSTNFFGQQSSQSQQQQQVQHHSGWNGSAKQKISQTSNQRLLTNESSTASNNGDSALTETLLLRNTKPKRAGLGKQSNSASSSSNGVGQLDFMSATNKAQYIDIKTKRIHDLNAIYTEGTNTDFNSQNVFMNKLVYNSSQATAIPATAHGLHYQSYQPGSSTGFASTAATPITGSYQAGIGQNYFTSLKSGPQMEYLGSDQQQQQHQHQLQQSHGRSISLKNSSADSAENSMLHGLKSFVQTMYQGGGTRNLMLNGSGQFNSDQNKHSKYSSYKPLRSKADEGEESSNSSATQSSFKTKDLFITKIKSTVVTPKFLFFQNKPRLSIQQKKLLPLPSHALMQQNSVEKGVGAFSAVDSSPQHHHPAPFSYDQNEEQHEQQQEQQKLLQVPQQLYSQQNLRGRGSQKDLVSQKDITNNSQGDIFNLYTQKTIGEEAQTSIASVGLLMKQCSTNASDVFLPETHWNHEYLFVFIVNLSQVSRKNNLKYVFLSIPQVQHLMSEYKLLEDFSNLKEQLKMRLAINSKQIYLFLDDGTPINSHMDIVRSENKEIRPIFVGGSGGFCGIANLYIPAERKANLVRVIAQLIDTNAQKQAKENALAGGGDNAVECMEQTSSSGSATNPREFQTREQFLRSENKAVVDKVVNILAHNPEAKIKRFEQTFNSSRLKQLTKIEEIYDKQITNFKKSVLEVEASSSLGDNPDIKQTKNLRQIAEFLDGFLEKSFPQAEQPLKSAVSEYNAVINTMSRPELKKKNHIRDNIERFNTPAMAMRRIQQNNRELFIKNIPKILTKYELSRSDLHSIYILYKALQTVSIQRIDWREVCKGGIDFKTFEHGIDKISSQSEEIIRRMCNYEDFIDWHQFIDILYAVSGKTLESKIDIFIKVADTDKSGNLSKTEIMELCQICLDKILPKEGDDDSMVSGLVEYFTRLLFTSLEVDIEDEIPLHKLKDAIINGHPENDLLCFFCGVDSAK